MKRTILIIAALGLALGSRAQADSTATCDSTDQSKLTLGIGASTTFFADGNDMSPYYSKYGFALHLSLCYTYELSPRWHLRAGLQYDFDWKPLYHRVETTADMEGLDFPSGPVQGSQHAHAFHGYLGIPVMVSWFPIPKHRKWLRLCLDVHPAYAVTRHFVLSDMVISRTGPNTTEAIGTEDTFIGRSLYPWKLEVGFSAATSQLGLLHGVRLFVNLLPTYKDVVTGENIYTAGLQFFL